MPLTADLLARIDALDAESVRLHSPLSGPQDLITSLNDHFDRALGLDSRFPTELPDPALFARLTEAFASEAARTHFNHTLQRPDDAQVQAQHVALLFARWVKVVVLEVDHILAAQLAGLPPAAHPYASCSLAQTFWSRQLFRRRRECFIAAALLLYPLRSSPPLAARAPAPSLTVDDYLALPVLAAHLWPAPAGTSSAAHVFEVMGASLYAQGRRYRPPTAREQAAGHTADQYGKAWLPGLALNAPPDQALNALLHSASFADRARELADAAQWDTVGDPLALAEQTLVDTLYPPEVRRPGFILDFELFTPTNANLGVAEIRLDLIDSLQASLACLPAIAELASELLLRRFAPELLLTGYPEDFSYQADLPWMQIRQGASMLIARQQPMTFELAEQAMQQPGTEGDPIAAAALRDTLAVWAPLKGGFEDSPPWSDRQWQLALDRYRVLRDQESLRDLPDRFEEARRQLRQAGIDPQGHNVDGQEHLQRYLDVGAGYRHIRELPDVTAWYESAFAAWVQRASKVYQAIFDRCLAHLPQDYQDRLRDQPWTAYAVTWPLYLGRGGQPAYGSGADEDWHRETATQGMVVHAPGKTCDLLCELFPERLEWRAHEIPPTSAERLASQLHLQYEQYNQTARPWHSADFPALLALREAPAKDRLAALAKCYAGSIALANREALHALGKGATQHELFLARTHSVGMGRYLLKLFSNIVPGVSCVAPQDGADAASCAADFITSAGAVLIVGGRLFRPIARLPGVLGDNAKAARLGATRAARRWSSGPDSAAMYSRVDNLRPWHSAPELAMGHPGPEGLRVQRHTLPGQTPDALLLDRFPGNDPPLAWNHPERPILIRRDAEHVDAIVQGTAYRYPSGQPGDLARRLQHEPLLGQPPAVESPPYPSPEARIALYFAPPANDAGTPLFGQQVSHAFQAVRIEPAPIRFRPQNSRFDTWAQVMVRDGKVVNHVPGNPSRIKPLPVNETQLRLGVIAPPVYHKRIVVDPSADVAFGLPDDLPADQVRHINRYCPPVRLGGLARTIADRRTLRGAIIDWRGEPWLVVEADLGVFYGAPYTPWAWQAQLPVTPRLPGQLPQPPRNLRRYFARIKDEEAIERYLEISETYRIVAQRSNLQHDIDNLTQLLRDWIDQGTAFEPVQPSPFLEFLKAAQERLLPIHARNILTQSPAQDALAGLARSGVVGLNREIIPNWRHFNAASGLERQRMRGILDDLLPASGSTSPYTLSTAPAELSPADIAALRQHVFPTNLAFASVTLKDQSRRVYFSLSGSVGRRPLTILAHPRTTPVVHYIDARQAMQGLPPDARFTELTSLRRVDFLELKQHKRHLDAERQIASALNRDLLERADEVESIEFFTLLDTCRSCGGFVLPRLRLDYRQARFSVTWMAEYPQ